MTREEAQKLLARHDGSTDSLLDLWEKLGVVKFDEPPSLDLKLREALRDTMVEVEWLPLMGLRSSDQVVGRLTATGVVAIMTAISHLGLKLVRA